MYQDAAEYYLKAIRKKDSNVEAKLGLRKTGQLALDQKLDKIKSAYQRADYKEAVYHYIEAENYYNKIGSVGVSLSFPEIYKSYFEESKSDYIGKRYGEGVDKLNREEFEASQRIFREIMDIDPDYKDVHDKYIIATYEPIYRQANEYLENERYRRAYYAFLEVIQGAGSYKQSLVLKDEALEKGTLTILVSDFTYAQSDARQVAEKFTSEIKAELSNSDNPFIKIIDPSLIGTDIYKYGKVDVETAKLAGIKAILNGEIKNLSIRAGRLNSQRKKGFIKEVNRVKNKDGTEVVDVKYLKTNYMEFQVKNSVQMDVVFQLISTDNGAIISSDQWSQTNQDEVYYATFEGNADKLVPGYWKYNSSDSDEDVILDNYNDVNKLQRLLKADRRIKTVSALQDELLENIAKKLTQKVESYNPD